MTDTPVPADTFAGMTSTGWEAIAALATVAAVLIALVGAYLAVRQLKTVIDQGAEARIAAHEAARPYIVVTIEPGEVSRAFMNLAIRNLGLRPAMQVRVRLSPVPVRANEIAGYELASARILSEEIAMIVPGQEMTTFFDSVGERFANPDLPNQFTAHVSYTDSTGHRFVETTSLDFAALKGTSYTDVLTTHHQVKVLKEIRDLLRKASVLQRDGHLDIDAVTEPREAAIPRREAERADYRAQAEARHADLVDRLVPRAQVSTEQDDTGDRQSDPDDANGLRPNPSPPPV